MCVGVILAMKKHLCVIPIRLCKANPSSRSSSELVLLISLSIPTHVGLVWRLGVPCMECHTDVHLVFCISTTRKFVA